jgi:hypothetical protein
VGVVGICPVVGNWWVGTATQACKVIDALSDELPSLVSEATQAVHVSLWLRRSRRVVEDAEEKSMAIFLVY